MDEFLKFWEDLIQRRPFVIAENAAHEAWIARQKFDAKLCLEQSDFLEDRSTKRAAKDCARVINEFK